MKVRMKRSTVIVLVTVILLGLLSVYIKDNGYLKSKAQILAECVTHDKKQSKHHYHLQLQIIQNDQLLPIPADTGINKQTECMHPLHTHDTTGKIHIEYPTSVRFTLGDFFDSAGIVFHDNQLGSMTTHEGYRIKAVINNKERTNNLRSIPLRDGDNIKLEIIYNQ